MRLRQSRKRDKERQAKRYVANPVFRLTKSAVNAERYAEGPVARQERVCARRVNYETEGTERVADACEQERVDNLPPA